MEGKVTEVKGMLGGIKEELRKEPEDWRCRFSDVKKFATERICRFAHVDCNGKFKDRKHCPMWRGRP